MQPLLLWMAVLCAGLGSLCFASLASAQKGSALIVPGESIGEVSLGMEQTDVLKKLGEPATGDAAGGRQWEAWFAPRGNGRGPELDIYFHALSNSRGPAANWIRIESPYFHTDTGISTQSSLADVWKVFPNLRYSRTDPQDGAVEFYADKSRGIAVEVRRTRTNPDSAVGSGEGWGVCRAIIIYLPGEFEDGDLPNVQSMRGMPNQ